MSDSNISSEEGVKQLDEVNDFIKKLKTEKDQKDVEIINLRQQIEKISNAKDTEIINLKQQIENSNKNNDQKYNNLFVEFNKLKDKIASVRNEHLNVRRDGRRRSKRKSPKRK
jgi:hypothetical protein